MILTKVKNPENRQRTWVSLWSRGENEPPHPHKQETRGLYTIHATSFFRWWLLLFFQETFKAQGRFVQNPQIRKNHEKSQVWVKRYFENIFSGRTWVWTNLKCASLGNILPYFQIEYFDRFVALIHGMGGILSLGKIWTVPFHSASPREMEQQSKFYLRDNIPPIPLWATQYLYTISVGYLSKLIITTCRIMYKITRLRWGKTYLSGTHLGIFALFVS